MMLWNRRLCRKKAAVPAVLLLVPLIIWLLLYSRIAKPSKPIEAFRENVLSDSLEDTSSACAEEFSSFPSKYYVIEALCKDGFRPVALSKNITSTTTPSTATQNVQVLRIINTTFIPLELTSKNDSNKTEVHIMNATFLLPELTSKNDSNRTREFQFLGLSKNCTKHRSRMIETDQVFIPNVVHYVFIGSDFQFKFITYLSFLSVERFLKPDQIFIHGDVIPSGKWWNATVEQVKNIYHVWMSYAKTAPNGQPFKYTAHISDYMRAEILLRYGGIYLDPDVLVLKSFLPLRQFPFVLGRERADGVCNGIMIAQKGSPFLRLMLEQYWSYKGPDEGWADLSVHNVHTLSQVYPHLIHVEEESLHRPNWMEVSLIYAGNYNWTTNYAMHLWLRKWPKEKLPSGLDDVQSNTTFGEMARYILFGTY